MKTTLAILGIFAAAVLATSFVATGYAITQSNTGTQTQANAGVQDSSGSAQAGIYNNNGNYQNQQNFAKQIAKNVAGLCTFC